MMYYCPALLSHALCSPKYAVQGVPHVDRQL